MTATSEVHAAAAGSRLILASGSAARRDMLRAAGLAFEVVPPNVDEDALRSRLLCDPVSEPKAIARALAEAKAREVSAGSPGALVIGADQILTLGSEIINKARTMDEARRTLARLRGNEHRLHSAVALAQDGHVVWGVVDSAKLFMWPFDDTYLERYLATVGQEILQSVGNYQIEGAGVRLFDRIDGNHFTILGLPLLDLLRELRRRATSGV